MASKVTRAVSKLAETLEEEEDDPSSQAQPDHMYSVEHAWIHRVHICDNPIGTQGPSESKVRMYFTASAVSALQLFQSLTVGMARLVRCGVAALAAISLQGVIHVEL